jgi:hypothetical protein
MCKLPNNGMEGKTPACLVFADERVIVLSGSNHIVEFAREYKNAFFGSCARVDLAGITERAEGEKLVAPLRVSPFIQFDIDAVDYAIELCAGMPQFMWQVGAATACRIRSGPAVRGDIRAAVGALVDERQDDLPFKPYDVLEPLEHNLELPPQPPPRITAAGKIARAPTPAL